MTDQEPAEAVRASDRAHGLPWHDPAAWGDLTAWHDSMKPLHEGRPVVVPMDEAQVSAGADAADWFTAQVRGTAPEPPPDDFLIPPGFAEDLRKMIAELFGIPGEMLAPLPPPTRRQRIRRKLGDWRTRAARRAFKIIAEEWPDDGEDDW